MSDATDYLEELLDRVRAMLKCGAGKAVEIARFVLPNNPVATSQVQVSQWLKGTRKPDGQNTLRLQAWAAAKTLEISAAGEEAREAYRVAFAETATGKKEALA